MRIIAGERRGLKLEAVDGLTTRPTADRVKEGLFNTIQMDVTPEKTVLDMFAGTGNLGLEALSRGAKHVTFIEKNPKALAVLKKNIEKCRFEKRCSIFAGDVFKILPRLQGQRYDLIFVDPPYHENLYLKIFSCISEYQLLEKYGILISEHAKNALFLYEDNVFLQYKMKTYGETTLNFYTQREPNGREL